MAKKIDPPFRIFVSSPADFWLTPNQKSVKHKVMDMLRADGFEVEFMGEAGMPFTQEKVWDHDRAKQIIRCCQGIVVIGLPRWYDALDPLNANQYRRLITEYSHSEGALAFAHQLPMLLLIEDGVEERGILHPTNTLVGIPQNSTDADLATNQNFLKQYAIWSKTVKERYHVFLGYSSGAEKTAQAILKFLRPKGIRVRDWKDFATTGTILQQIEQADQTCLGGLFLFTTDDLLTSPAGRTQQVPRDNVIFEAGYFMNSKGENRVQIILEKDAKLLADLTSQIYLSLEDRNDITSIKQGLLKFIRKQLSNL